MTTRPTLILIAAVARRGVIGRDNQLLWHLPEDMAYFRRQTQGSAVLMGRKTWDSLPPRFRPLPGRRNLVLSRQDDLQCPGAEVVGTIEQALQALAGADKVFVIGGEQIYRLALPLADQLMLTEIERDYDGDAYFPEWRREDFAEVSRQTHHAGEPNDFDYSFVTYTRRPVPAKA